jgi:hypothetical protein
LKIKREEALTLRAYFIMASQTLEERMNMLLDALSSDGELDRYDAIVDFFDPSLNDVLIDHLREVNKGIINSYLSDFLSRKMAAHISVDGAAEVLGPCPCCGFRTLTEPGEYDICVVCFWEDDGSFEDEYSHPNRMTLVEAKSNFANDGTVYASLRDRKLDPDRFLMYAKE